MENINNYWTDENNNKWSSSFYTQEQAEICSNSLESCVCCTNCHDCSYSFKCVNCMFCADCSYCVDCNYCNNCYQCSECSYFKDNPNRYVGQRMGRRNLQITTYWNNNNIWIKYECWRGTLKEFEKHVQRVHGNGKNKKYYQQCQKYITTVKKIVELEEKCSQV